MKKILLLLIAAFAFNTAFSQDIIVFKTGDEIQAKILEITTDQIKYKKWDNVDGPNYTSTKAEVFMIKYRNGTKDVFNTSTLTNSNLAQTSIINNGNKFIGVWHPKKYNGNSNKTTLTISKPGEDYLVNYNVYVQVDQYFHSTDGTFKEMGKLEGNSIVVNSFIKLSLMNDTTILMNSVEFYKSNSSNQTNNDNKIIDKKEAIAPKTTGPILQSYLGSYKDGKKEGWGKKTYIDGSTYEGDWKNDKRDGHGEQTYSDSSIYDGDWINDRREGFGIMYYSGGVQYNGNWKEDKYEGVGKLVDARGDIYTGSFKNNLKEGDGVKIFKNTSDIVVESKFVGTYKDDKEFNGVLSSIDWKGKKSELIVKDGVFGKWKKVNN